MNNKRQRSTSKKRSLSKCNNDDAFTNVSTHISSSSSIENVNGLDNTWMIRTKDIANKLWIPTVTNSSVLHTNSLHGSFINNKSNSWFNIKQWVSQQPTKIQNIQLPSLTSLISSNTQSTCNNSKDLEPKKKKIKVNSAKKTIKQTPNQHRKIKLNFSPEDKNTVLKWFGCARKTYNWALACIKSKPKEYNINMIWLRKRFINSCNMPKKFIYLLDCPKEIRDGAINDLVGAYKINIDKRKNNPHFKYDIKFRSRKENQSIYIGADSAKFKKPESKHMKDWNKGQFKIYPSKLLSIIKFYTRKRDKNNVNIPKYDCRLSMNQLGEIYLHIPQFREVRCDNQAPDNSKIASIDPGVRTFLTIYSSQVGVAYKLGDNDIGRIMRLGYWLDKLISKLSSVKKHSQRRRVKRAILRHRQRIKHIVDEVHWKCIKFLVNNFSTIYLPKYNTSQMVLRKSRKINSKAVRMMLSWRFYEFKQRLVQQAELANVNIIHCTEEYTSKTCGQCHAVKTNLGSSKKFICNKCNIQLDRDLNGARNIFIKNYFEGKIITEGLKVNSL